jgi:uncharacterized membrane protein
VTENERFLIGLALALAVIFFMLWAAIGFRDLPGDMILYFDYANHIKDGHLPYRDFQLEYPPLALVPILIAFWPSHAFGGFFRGFDALFAIETYLLALGTGLIVWKMLERVMPEATEHERRWRMIAYVAAFPLLGQVVTTRFDLAPTLMTVAALALWLRRTPNAEVAGWLVLAVGVATKLSPVVIGPLFALDLLRRRGLRAAIQGGLLFLAACAVLILPGLIASPSGLRHAFTYQADRGVQIESVYASVLLWVGHLTSFNVVTAHAFGSFEAVSSWTPRLRTISSIVQVASLGLVYLAYFVRSRRPADATVQSQQIVVASLLAIGMFIISGRVFSPQYMIWLIPLVVLIPGQIGRRTIALFLATLVMTQVIFPYGYDQLRHQTLLGITLISVRNLLFIAVTILIWIAFLRDQRAQQGQQIHD